MKITYLWIDGYKNLNDVEIILDENSSVNAFIGNNGSGKSNIIEAIMKIFRAVKQDLPELFNYHLKYRIDNELFEIYHNKNEAVMWMKKGGDIVLKKNQTIHLPSTIFLYYAGETTRLNVYSDTFVDKSFDKALKTKDEILLKYFSFIDLKDFPTTLLANAIFDTKTYEKVCELIGISEIGSLIRIHIKRPFWSKTADITNDSFWAARGTVAILLHQLKDIGKLEIINKDKAYIEISSKNQLTKINKTAYDILVKLKLLMQADIVSEVEFDIIKNGDIISASELSEGEKQISQLLSFLEITKDYKALFLLDEIDSYLHPNWQREFMEIIGGIEIRGQILFTTHSPLTISKMNKDNIRIIKNGEIFMPKADTFNRDISELMEEVMDVGLRPVEVEKTITNFRNNIVHGNVEIAMIYYETLKDLLSEEDPFWITANNFVKRFGGQK